MEFLESDVWRSVLSSHEEDLQTGEKLTFKFWSLLNMYKCIKLYIHTPLIFSPVISASILQSNDPNLQGFLLSWGAGLLDLFCRLNWTGPPLTSDGETTLAELSRFNNKSLDILSWDSEVRLGQRFVHTNEYIAMCA